MSPKPEDELKKNLTALVANVLTQAAGPLVDRMVDTVRDAARKRATASVEAERIRRAAEAPPADRGAPKAPPTPYAVLRVAIGAPLEVCEAAYKALSRTCHPDGLGQGADPKERRRREERQKALNLAIEAIRRERGAGRSGD